MILMDISHKHRNDVKVKLSTIYQLQIYHFALGYVVTISAGLLSYPIDTIRRRMMMTSGEAVK
jgi:hypothetical protein